MPERKPRKPKNYGQKGLPGVEEHMEAEAAKNERAIGMPNLELVKTYIASIGLTEQDAEDIYDNWLANGFRTKSGMKVRDWKAAIRIWNRNDWFPSQKKAAKAMEKLAEKEQRQKEAIRRMKGGH